MKGASIVGFFVLCCIVGSLSEQKPGAPTQPPDPPVSDPPPLVKEPPSNLPLGGPVPPLPPELTARTLKVAGDSYGQFWTDCQANGAAFRCLVDTGADAISFGRRDARRVGIDLKRLKFDGLASTANGTVKTAKTTIARLQVGPFTLSDVPVEVLDSDMEMPLLGMAWLRRFKLTVGGDVLIISE